MKMLTTLLLALMVAAPAVAQQREIRTANLPRTLETRLLRMYDGAAERHEGPLEVGAGERISGDIAAMGGPLRVAGSVVGDIAMVNGDVILEPGSQVTGSITVIGGEVRMASGVVAGGSITVYGVTASPHQADRDRSTRDRDRWRERERAPRQHPGYSRLTLRTGTSYNRVEGLPIMFGPVLETAGANPLRLEALAIWRTESGASLETDQMGYQVTAEQFLGGARSASVGATLHSVVDPLDRWQLRDLEASLAAVLFRQDYRDRFERTGWSAFVRARPTPGLDARVTYRAERHAALPTGDPWSLFARSGSWRLQPLIAEGDIRTLGASVELDRRERRDHARSGWLAQASVERPVGGSLTRPALDAVSAGPDFQDLTAVTASPLPRSSTMAISPSIWAWVSCATGSTTTGGRMSRWTPAPPGWHSWTRVAAGSTAMPVRPHGLVEPEH